VQQAELLFEVFACYLFEGSLHIFGIGVSEFPGGEVGLHTFFQLFVADGNRGESVQFNRIRMVKL